ncbi:MAG: toll/interleukin-1 receptor domain-containing protein [Bacteroidetes bacterium]|nr:toll/interleukin-1 receptor domain-containing protein [Bacteroidota bacterium]
MTIRLSPKMVANRLRELQGIGTVSSSYLRQCEALCAALDEAARQDNALPFPKALETLYPDAAYESVMDAFRIWRSRLNQQLNAANATFRLSVSQNRRLPLAERLCWFEGEDRTAATFGTFSDAEAWLDGPIEEARGRPLTITYFVSYAHADREPVESLLKRLHPRLSRAKGFKFMPWRDIDIMVPGQIISTEIEAGIHGCQIGLQMVSHEYMASKFVLEHELPRFAPGERLASDPNLRLGFPIAIDHPDFENTEWGEFSRNRRLLFFHNGKAYQDLREVDPDLRELNRDAFADACAEKIIRTAREYFGGSDDRPVPSERLTEETMREAVSADFSAEYVPARGHGTQLQQRYRSASDDASPETQGVLVLNHLLHWATLRRSLPLFALLGEYGMGKTVNCKQLTLKLLKLRKQAEADTSAPPMPVYLDMRYARGLFPSETLQQGSRRFEHVEIDDLVNTIFRESWKAREKPDATDLRRLVAGGNVLIIFDGFDEVAVHLHPDEAQSLIRTMWSLVPPDTLSADVERRPSGTAAVQMLISCRTHYFRDVTQQVNLFAGHQRELDSGADLYDAITLLPFTEEQIERFLTAKLGDKIKARRALDTIRSIHNLPELVQRPVLLDRICGQLEQIEALAETGERINAARLYDLLADEWLARDNAKHTLDVEIKKTLMARLSGAMWRSGERFWPAGEIEEWLDGELRIDARLNERYAGLYQGKAREILYEDLRTSAFVVRSDNEGFRFAHTSIQEFFLAKYLFQTMRDGEADAWEGIAPSPECLDFLAEIACENAREVEKRSFFNELGTLLRRSYRPGISEVAFRVVLDAQHRGETASPRGRYQLENAKLSGWNITGEDGTGRIDLSGSDFTGAVLRNVQVCDVIAQGCVFDSATLEFALFERVDLSGSSFDRARSLASVFRQCQMRAVQNNDSAWRNTTFLHCNDLPELLRSDDQSGKPLIISRDTLRSLWAQSGSSRLQVQTSNHRSVGGCAFSPDGTRGVFHGYANTLCLWHVKTGVKMAILQGHGGRVGVCTFSPDGERVLSGSDDGTLRLWDGITGIEIAVLQGHSHPVGACAFSPDGARIVSGSDDGTLRVWNGATGEKIAVLHGHARHHPVRTCAFSPDGTRIISGSDDRTLRVWNGATGEKIAVLHGHAQRVRVCVYSPDGARIVSGSYDGTLRLWDGETNAAIADLQGHAEMISILTFSPDGTRILSGSDDGTMRLWGGETGAEIVAFRGHTTAISACVFSPDGRRILSGSNDGTLRLWGADTGETIRTLRGHTERIVACSFSSDGTQVASWCSRSSLRLWDGQDGEKITVFQSYAVPVGAFAFSPDGTRIVSGAGDGTLHLWDVETNERFAILEGHTKGVNSCAFSPDGTRIVSGSDDGTLRLWQGESGEEIAVLQGHTGEVDSCTFNPDGTRVVSGGHRDTVRLWDTDRGEEILGPHRHLHGDWTCAFNSEGTRAIFGGFGPARLYNIETGEGIAVLEDQIGGSFVHAFSPEGTRVVCGSHDRLHFWNTAETGRRLLVHEDHVKGISICTFCPDETSIILGSYDGTLRLRDFKTGKQIKVLEGHTESVRTLAFSPDGTRVLSGSDDGTLRIWGIDTGKEIAVLRGHTGNVLACAFSPDGTRVVSASNDGTLRLWDAVIAKAATVIHHLPEGGHLVLSEPDKRVISASGNAWRHFRWFASDRNSCLMLPLEADPRIGTISKNGYLLSAAERSGPDLRSNTLRSRELQSSHVSVQGWER